MEIDFNIIDLKIYADKIGYPISTQEADLGINLIKSHLQGMISDEMLNDCIKNYILDIRE